MELTLVYDGFPTLSTGHTNDYHLTFMISGKWDIPEDNVSCRCFLTPSEGLLVYSREVYPSLVFRRDGNRDAKVLLDVTATMPGRQHIEILVVNQHGMPVLQGRVDIDVTPRNTP